MSKILLSSILALSLTTATALAGDKVYKTPAPEQGTITKSTGVVTGTPIDVVVFILVLLGIIVFPPNGGPFSS